MNEILALAAQRRHLWAGWGWARRCHAKGPDGITVAQFGAALTKELDVLSAEFSAATFVWGPTGPASGEMQVHSVRDRVAAGAIRAAMRELELKGQLIWKP